MQDGLRLLPINEIKMQLCLAGEKDVSVVILVRCFSKVMT